MVHVAASREAGCLLALDQPEKDAVNAIQDAVVGRRFAWISSQRSAAASDCRNARISLRIPIRSDYLLDGYRGLVIQHDSLFRLTFGCSPAISL